MTATGISTMKDMSVLEPGRYVVRGGPGGRYAVSQPRADRYTMIGGRLRMSVSVRPASAKPNASSAVWRMP